MADVLFLYSTVDGQTRRICERLQAVVEAAGDRATLHSIDDGAIDLARFDKVVIGASIRYGKHRANVHALVREQRAALDAKPSAFFTVNVVARKPAKSEPATNPYMRKFLADTGWQPRALAVFAGRIDYALYGWRDRTIIRFIMWLTKGPTERHAAVEFTDWARVEAFGREIAALR